MAFAVKLLGVRGTLPTPLTPSQRDDKIKQAIQAFIASPQASVFEVQEFMKDYPAHLRGGYGGHTSCVQISSKSEQLIIDCGTGLSQLVPELANTEFKEGKGQIHILMTHFHWDHLMGLLTFFPLFIKGNKIHFYAVQPELAQVIKAIFQKPFFPVPFESLGGTLYFHQLSPREPRPINGFNITPYQLDHPDPCWGFRVEKDGAVYSHCVDTEGVRLTPEELGPDLPLYQNVDLMLFDSQYTMQEITEKVNWGHATANFGIDLALTQNIRKILFAHHDPFASDSKIKETSVQVQHYYESMCRMYKKNNIPFNDVEWDIAREGMRIEVKV